MPNSPERWVALSIRQPWIDMILRGEKTMELRIWPIKRRGPILLHAAQTIDWKTVHLLDYPAPLELARGAIVGYAEIQDVIALNRAAWLRNLSGHRVVHPPRPGTYGAILTNVRRLKQPVRCGGKPYFFPLADRVLERVLSQLQLTNGEE